MDLVNAVPAARLYHTYKYKGDDQLCVDGRKIESFSIIDLTLGEERAAGALGSPEEAGLNLMKQALRKVNGKAVGLGGSGEASADEWVAVLTPRQRDFMRAAYKRTNSIGDAELVDFFKEVSSSAE